MRISCSSLAALVTLSFGFLIPSPSIADGLSRDSRECAYEAAIGTGLYEEGDLTMEEFLRKSPTDLLRYAGTDCSTMRSSVARGFRRALAGERVSSASVYPGEVLKFAESFRSCLEGRGYEGFLTFMSILCTEESTWELFADYHADRI